MIKFIAHTVREFPREKDFKEFMEYLSESGHIPSQHMLLLKNKKGCEVLTFDGQNQDCRSVTTWSFDTGYPPAEKK